MDLELIGRLLGWATAATVALTGLWTYFGKSKDSAWTRLVSENDRVRRDLQEMKADLRSTNERLEKVESELEELRADRRTLMDFLRDVVSGQFPLDWIQTRAQELLTFNGAAAFRHMGHSRARPLSVHAFGAALDFDAAWNAYGVPLAQQQIDRDVIRVFQECGWEWGGLWSDPYEDGMHLQWTDPLPGVPQPAWRDAMARGEGSALKPKPTPVPAPVTVVKPAPPAPVVLVPDGAGGWRDVAGQRTTLPGGTVVNATDPARIWIAER